MLSSSYEHKQSFCAETSMVICGLRLSVCASTATVHPALSSVGKKCENERVGKQVQGDQAASWRHQTGDKINASHISWNTYLDICSRKRPWGIFWRVHSPPQDVSSHCKIQFVAKNGSDKQIAFGFQLKFTWNIISYQSSPRLGGQMANLLYKKPWRRRVEPSPSAKSLW